jgi:hypothetical protein
VNVQLQAGGPPAKKIGYQGIPNVVFLDSNGNEIGRIGGFMPAGDFIRPMQAAADKADKLMQESIDKDLASDKPSVKATALTKLGGIRNPSAAATLLEWVKKADAPLAVRTAALEGMGKQATGAEELVPLLVDKVASVRSSASKALTAQGPAAVPALFGGLESENGDLRAACYGIAAATTKFPGAKFGAFWKTSGDEAARKDVLAKWREYWDKKKPAESK